MSSRTCSENELTHLFWKWAHVPVLKRTHKPVLKMSLQSCLEMSSRTCLEMSSRTCSETRRRCVTPSGPASERWPHAWTRPDSGRTGRLAPAPPAATGCSTQQGQRVCHWLQYTMAVHSRVKEYAIGCSTQQGQRVRHWLQYTAGSKSMPLAAVHNRVKEYAIGWSTGRVKEYIGLYNSAVISCSKDKIKEYVLTFSCHFLGV